METSKDTKSYHEQKYIDNTLRLRSILKTLPPFAKDYFRAIEPTTSARTRISYAYDIRVFFHFLMENNPVYKNYSIDQFTVQDLERLEAVDIEEYQEYLKVYENDEKKQITNTEKGLARKMSALRSFYGYYFKHQIISKNPTLLDSRALRPCCWTTWTTAGDNLTGQRKAYYEKDKKPGSGYSHSFCWEPVSVYLNVSVWIFRMWILRIMESKLQEKAAMRWSYTLVKKLKMP